ncbi:PilC/PilY family type IV pilus protein [Diaphorobacter sp.]|uniref:pilus assembly protein n=1 Tax=Diaphorobacter sp. TaxID=1934310 RepID=UPI0028AA3CC5|nr:PilC/PilY family type IV pilus protein [Diaphorobacter sp.]
MPHFCRKSTLALLAATAIPMHAMAVVPLADQPVLSSSHVPGNLALALSVEYPTAERVAHTDDYSSTATFLGYFDPDKCYKYVSNSAKIKTDGGVTVDEDKGDQGYFTPYSISTKRSCSGYWSGNFLNWATMSTIDPFRWAMTGGHRVVDSATETILQKTWHNGNLFPNKTLRKSLASISTPFNQDITIAISGLGFAMKIGSNQYTVRVKVCDSSVGLESNCKAYGNSYKPEGLIQKYSQEMRFSAFGYLNDNDILRDGGVLRAKQKFVSPMQPMPGQPSIVNTAAEWSATDGTYIRNPDKADASATASASGVSILDSGVINYLNKFGQLLPGSYKSIDPVNELYYAVLRYYRNLGNISSWSDLSSTSSISTKTKWLDGFPVITNWSDIDPVQYSCQRNFILGIGDVNTHRDKNVPGNSMKTEEPTMPAFGDSLFNAVTSTNKVKQLQGMSGSATTLTGSSQSTDYMAGLAYQANVLDIRPDDDSKPQTKGKQTVQTYWVDVMENPDFVTNNKFYLAAKFGAMKVPTNFNYNSFSGPIPKEWWSTNGEKVGSQDRPDSFFTGRNPASLISGLTRAFENIVGDIKAYTTTFSLATKHIAGDSEASYAAQYDASNWSGQITASTVSINSAGDPSLATAPTWNTRTVFETQLSGNGWNTGRKIVTMGTPTATSSGAIPFRHASLTTAQKALLNTSYVDGDDSANYVNFLRGDPSQEGSGYRVRSEVTSTGTVRHRLGDIVNSKLTAVGAPSARFADIFNPGYSKFKRDNQNRVTMLYVGANDGMMHAFKGGLDVSAGAGQEVFAYIPGALFHKTATADNDGLLARLGNPLYSHRNYVDATPLVFDIDMARAGGATQTDATVSDWRSVLIGGLGKGGRSYYAIDVTNPANMTSETEVARKVLWEFPARNLLPVASGGTCTTKCIDMGFSFGDPVVVKTARYGWVVVLASGYNNADGKGHIFLVNPTNGELLADISTGTENSSGMAHPAAYVLDYSDFTADSIYVGDLEGRVWRFPLNKLEANGNYPAPTLIARFTSPAATSGTPGAAQPITTQPLIEIDPATRRRYVLVGTGKLLDGSDILSSQHQSFYAIVDGYSDMFSTKALDGDNWPAVRSDFAVVESTDDSTPRKANMNGKAGWVIELGVTANVGWRVVGKTTSYNGTVGFSSVLPSGDECNPSGKSNVYAVSFAAGKSVLDDHVDFLQRDSVVIDYSFFNAHGKVQPWIGDNKGSLDKVGGTFYTPHSRSLNWRELSNLH